MDFWQGTASTAVTELKPPHRQGWTIMTRVAWRIAPPSERGGIQHV